MATNQVYNVKRGTSKTLPLPIISTRAPTATDTQYPLGQSWIDKDSDQAYILTSKSGGSANWALASPGSSDVDTLTGDSGGALSPTAGNINILGGDGITVAGSGSTLTINRDAEGGYPVTQYVVGSSGEAGYTTVQSAVDAANAAGGGVVYIQPGTYSESLTLYDGVNLRGLTFSDVIITGIHTPPNSGTVVFQNLTLTSATNIFNSVAAGTTEIVLEDCVVTVTNGYVFNLLNWTGDLIISETDANGTNDGIVNNTGGSSIILHASTLGVGTGNSMIASGGTVQVLESQIGCPATFGGSASVTLDSGSTFTRTITTANTAAIVITSCNLSTGATAAISHGSSGTIELSSVAIDSSADPVLAGSGSGVITLSSVSFTSGSNIAATLTTASGIIRGGNFVSQFVVGLAPDAQYQTIQSAITAAAATGVPQTVIVQPGTYTENLTLSSTVDIRGSTFSGVTITGAHTPPTTGRFTIQNCTLTSATDVFSSAAAGSAEIIVEDCVITVTNGFLFDLDNWTGNLIVSATDSNGTNDGIVNNTGGATVILHSSTLGVGTGNPMVASGGSVEILECQIQCPVTLGGAGTFVIDSGCSFINTLTIADSNAGSINNSNFTTSGASITMSSSGAVFLENCVINSANNPAISGAGAGTFTLGTCTFVDNAALAGTLTVAYSTTLAGPTSITGNSNINGSGTGTTTIGNGTAGAVTVDSAAGISLDAATASNFTCSLASSAAAVTISASAADGGITLDAGVTPGVTFTNGTQSHQMLVGSGSPNGSVTAAQGSLYVDVAGSSSTTILFANTDGGTTWVGVGA